MIRQWISLSVCVVLQCVCVSASPQSDAEYFENHIRPLLVERCQGCHCSSTGKTSGGLALDTRAGWEKGGDSGPAIVPGKPQESLLVKAIHYEEDGPQMPPQEKGGKLSKEQIEAVVEWIRQGAIDPRSMEKSIGGMTANQAERWWAFLPLVKTAVPEADFAGWPRGEIDRFIRLEQEKHGLSPMPDADKRTLVRRVTLDLTGLPPTQEDIAAYLSDESSEAFAKIVDRLLASPEYGVRWGRHWLDVARYADTAGDGADYPVREAGLYRNWVVSAFNSDQPFDDFVREQIAGDILAEQGSSEDYARRVTATGFLAIGKRYGYSPTPAYQHLDFADAIDSIGRSLLGLSIGCARCHDHKYDPISMADYYGLYGILQSTQWSFPGGEEHKRPAHFPGLVIPAEAARLDQQKAEQLASFDADIAKLKQEKASLDGRLCAGGIDLGFESQSLEAPPAAPWLSQGPNKVIADAQSPFSHIHPTGMRGVRMGVGKPNDGVRYVFDQKIRAQPGGHIHFTIDFRTLAEATETGAFRFYLGRGVIESLALECSISSRECAVRDGAAWKVVRKLEPGTWYTLRVSIDSDTKTFSGVVGVTGDLTDFRGCTLPPAWDGVIDTFICDGIGHGDGSTPIHDLDNVGLTQEPFAEPGSGPIVLPLPGVDAKQRIASIDGALWEKTKQREVRSAASAYRVAYGVSEGKPMNARIQKRGEPEQLAEEVPRRYLEIFGGDRLPETSHGSGRLELADWITRRSQHLLARVFVNRVWQWHFGRGLVGTSSDFGSRGEMPTHPELLEWLALKFIESGWSVKSLHRTIVLSRTYQLSSNSVAEMDAIDPENIQLWRYTRRQLDAESIRDSMLSVSGLLNREVLCEHPFPDVTTWGFTIHQPFFAEYESNHRSIYLMVQRNRRHPFLALFDAADPNQSIAQRLPTTTPTQTLYLMNSPFVHQQSDAFAARLLGMSGGDQERVTRAFEMTTGKIPADAERDECLQFVEKYSQSLLERNIAPAHERDLAWAALSRVLMTSNGFLSVD